MKKKILLSFVIIFCLCFAFNVNAITCSNEQINDARATLKIWNSKKVNLPSLNRNYSYIYNFKLGNTRAYCLDNGKRAQSGSIYKIIGTASNPTYYKAYNFARVADITSERYIVAQAAIWSSEANKDFNKTVLELAINMNCIDIIKKSIKNFNLTTDSPEHAEETYYGMKEAADGICKRVVQSNADDLYKELQDEFHNTYKSYITQYTETEFKINLFSSYIDLINEFNNTSKYNGQLYIWQIENEDGKYQRLLAPLVCDDIPNDNTHTCTTSDGLVVDYSNEYNTCVANGKSDELCTAELNSKYCSSNQFGTIRYTGSNAVCENSGTNYGIFNEYVDLNTPGTAIPDIGEEEKQINSYCNLYCIENSAQQIFPGNVRNSVSTGTYIIWPTSEATTSSIYGNNYPLKFSGQKTCTVVMAGENSSINKTNLQETLNKLIENVESLESYEVTRTSGGCANASTLGCKTEYGNMNYWKNMRDNYADSPEYKNAIKEQETINSTNYCPHDYASHIGHINCTGDYCTEIDIFCGDPNSESCQTIKDQCEKQKESSCTPGKAELSTESKKALEKYAEYDSKYNQALDNFNNCQSACYRYENAVNNVVNFANSISGCATYTPSCSGSSCEIYDFDTNVDLSWGDPEYGNVITDSQLEKNKNYSYRIEGSSSVIQVSKNSSYKDIKTNTQNLLKQVESIVQNRKIIANVDVTYSLPTNPNELLYNYVVKRNDSFKSQTAKPSEDSNYTTIGFSNLPISFGATPKVSYELRLSNIRFGDNGGQYCPDDYVCNYNVVNTPSNNCLCPVGTKYENKDLTQYMIDNNMTCNEAKTSGVCDIEEPYCTNKNGETVDLTNCLSSNDWFTCYDLNCSDTNKDKYCPYPPYNYISTCLNNFSYDYCVNLICPLGTYKCKNTNGVNGDMDITSCVYTKVGQGLTVDEAIDECDSLICPYGGLRIIYRTISLENPFPGKNITNKVDGFNDDVKGRYPGFNWNDLKLVQNHILTVNRQNTLYDGSAIYQGEPLYTFVLTTETINNIRNYNDLRVVNGGYADYTLDCKLNNSRACVSEFVHSEEYGLTGGVCFNATNRTNFYTCSGD